MQGRGELQIADELADHAQGDVALVLVTHSPEAEAGSRGPLGEGIQKFRLADAHRAAQEHDPAGATA